MPLPWQWRDDYSWCWLFVVCWLLLVVCYWLLVVGCWLSVVCFIKYQISSNKQLITNNISVATDVVTDVADELSVNRFMDSIDSINHDCQPPPIR
ncbi:MAG TPA: hypothetical protein DCY91_09615 [Cyanobacteria bacterium UBA11370]|nr:hypothetical protein [Cyanobacteria bacterium UBA11370]